MDARQRARFFLLSFLLFVALPPWVGAQAPPPKDTKETDVQALQQQLDALRAQVADLQNQVKKLTSNNSTNQNGTDQQQAQSAVSSQSSQTSDQNGAGQQQTQSANTGQSAQSSQSTQTSDQTGKASDAAKELGTGQGVGQATSEYKLNSQDQEAAARYDNAPLDPKYPGYFRLPGTRTFLKIGGYAKSDFTFDPRPAGDQERFIPASIPIPAPANVNNSTVSVRPSRINLDFLVPFKDERTIRFFVEMDFFGSSSTTPRLRHAYAQGKNLLIGQTFSNFMDPDSGPDTLDFEGPNSQISIRTPQMRYTFRLGKKTTTSIAIEKPTSDVSFSTPDFTAQPNSPSPDGTIQFRHEWDSGHVQFAALMRDVAAFLPDGRSDSVFGWGFNLTGLFKMGKSNNFVYQGEYGHGITRYIQDTSGLGIDAAVISALKPELEAVPVVGTYGGLQHYWVSKLRSSAVFGFVQAQNTPAQRASAFHQSGYSAVNLIWSPISQLSLGTEFLYGWRLNKDGSTGNAPRIQVSAKYNFMQIKSSNK